MQSINPATGQIIRDYPEHGPAELAAILDDVAKAARDFSRTTFAERARCMTALAELLAAEAATHARLITLEMGKILREAEAEVRKCAQVCDYYAGRAEAMLGPMPVLTAVASSVVTFEPLGVILGIMPWNFPFWQAIRFAAPAIMAGNAVVLKHAPNVCGCALTVEDLFRRAGFPENVFRALLIPVDMTEASGPSGGARGEPDGQRRAGDRGRVGREASQKKRAGAWRIGPVHRPGRRGPGLGRAHRRGGPASGLRPGVHRLKRFIVVREVAERFTELLVAAMSRYEPGDPMEPGTTLGPMAREDLRASLAAQIGRCVDMGARLALGGHVVDRPGFYHEPTLLCDVPGACRPTRRRCSAGRGASGGRGPERPVSGQRHAVWPGAGIWTADRDVAMSLARRVEAGTVTINGMTKSEPALPFGGVKNSGYGRSCRSSASGSREHQAIGRFRASERFEKIGRPMSGETMT